jgi:hypothetical protein
VETRTGIKVSRENDSTAESSRDARRRFVQLLGGGLDHRVELPAAALRKYLGPAENLEHRALPRSHGRFVEATGKKSAVAGTIRALRGPARDVGGPCIRVRGTGRAVI